MGLGSGGDGHRGGSPVGYGLIVHPALARARQRRIAMAPRRSLRDALRVEPGSRIRLEGMDHGATHGYDKASAAPVLEERMAELASLQDRLWAESKHAVLVVLQGIDAAGKDGTINKVMEAFNPQGCVVSSFKVPTAEELAHDYLWRVPQRVQKRGEVGVFNRIGRAHV